MNLTGFRKLGKNMFWKSAEKSAILQYFQARERNKYKAQIMTNKRDAKRPKKKNNKMKTYIYIYIILISKCNLNSLSLWSRIITD